MSEGGGGERAQSRRFIIASRPLLPGMHALLVWMSQLTSSDNCEPRALSKGTTVIVLIGPLSCYVGAQNAFKCDCSAAFETEARTAHNIKKKMSAFYFTEDNHLALWSSGLGAVPGLEPARPISNCRERPPLARNSIRRLGTRCVTFKPANKDGHANESGRGLSRWSWRAETGLETAAAAAGSPDPGGPALPRPPGTRLATGTTLLIPEKKKEDRYITK